MGEVAVLQLKILEALQALEAGQARRGGLVVRVELPQVAGHSRLAPGQVGHVVAGESEAPEAGESPNLVHHVGHEQVVVAEVQFCNGDQIVEGVWLDDPDPRPGHLQSLDSEAASE